MDTSGRTPLDSGFDPENIERFGLQGVVALHRAHSIISSLSGDPAWYDEDVTKVTITPVVATTLLWLMIFQPEYGVANYVLQKFGIPKQLWLLSPEQAKPVLILMALWGVGGGMPIFLAGLQAIPREVYEAAEIDGSNIWNSFVYVTLPLLTPVIFFSVITGIIGSFQVFANAYVATNGRPAHAINAPSPS